MSPTALTTVRDALARARSVDAVNQLGRDTGQAIRLRTESTIHANGLRAGTRCVRATGA